MAMVIVIWGLTATLAAFLATVLAGVKRRDWSFWLAICFLIPPLVLFLAFLPPYPVRPRRPSLDEEDRLGV